MAIRKKLNDYLHKFIFLLGEDRRKLFPLFSFFLISSLLDMVGIGLLAPFISLVSNPETISNFSIWVRLMESVGIVEFFDSIMILGLIIIILFYFKGFMSYWIKKRIVLYSLNIQSKLTCKLMSAYQMMPYQFHLKRNTASLILATSNHTSKFAHHTLMQALGLLSEFFVVVMILILLATTSFIVLLSMSILLAIIYFFYDRLIKDRAKQAGEDTANANESIIKGVTQGIEGLREIRVYGSELYFYNKIKESTTKFAEVSTDLNGLKIVPRYLFESAIITFMIGLILISLLNTETSSNLLYLIGMFGLAAIRLIPSAGKISGAIISMRYSKFALDALYKDINELKDIDFNSTSFLTDNLEKKIPRLDFSTLEIKDINFRYADTDIDAISNLSFIIEKNQSVGIMGKSGSGKTTLINILLGLLTPQNGAIKLNGDSIRNDLRAWLNIVAYIPQDVFILDDTIKRNIAIGTPDGDIDMDKLSRSIRVAQLEDVIDKLPNNIETIVGQRGIKLSGGERQRLALARAFYHEREVIIMDEATSALDNETEKFLVNAINQLKINKTIIMIAHRLSTLKDCDVIYEIENGNIINSGKLDSIV